MPAIIQLESGHIFMVMREQRAVLGRDRNLEVTIPHPKVSRQHADVQFIDGQWILTDLDTANGTYVEGERVKSVNLSESGPVSLRVGGKGGPELVITTTPEVGDGKPEHTVAPASRERIPLPRLLKIGSSAQNEVIVTDSGIAPYQASISENAKGFHEVIDTTGNGMTLVNAIPITRRARLKPGDIVRVGEWEMRYTGRALEHVDAEGGFAFSAHGLTVLAGSKKILDNVSFDLRPRTLTAVIGPSGSGKSTLLGALTGRRPATYGDVLVGGANLYEHYGYLKSRIGLVPQSDLLHTNLTTKKALEYSAALRFPRHESKEVQLERVDEVMELLGLSERHDVRIDALSGGQRKRASVALELLTEPELLFLDEPTSGLDPGLDRQVMNQLRTLASGGRTVLVVTHSVANLDVCDEVIVMAPGGKLAYHGPAHNVLDHFGADDWAEVFNRLEHFVQAPPLPQHQQVRSHSPHDFDVSPEPGQTWFRQLVTLMSRYMKVISSDKYFLALLGVLPFVLAVVGFAVGTDSGISAGPDKDFGLNPQARPLMLVLILGASFMGLSASVQELVKERQIYDRERSVGISASAYLLSKILILGTLVTLQVIVFVSITLANRDTPNTGVVLGSAFAEVLIVCILLGISSMLLGLLISALVNSSEVTMPALVLTTMGQVVLSGAVPIRQGGLLDVVGLPNPGYWAMNAIAATADLNTIGGLSGDDQGVFWAREADNWFISVAAVGLLAIVIGATTRLILAQRER